MKTLPALSALLLALFAAPLAIAASSHPAHGDAVQGDCQGVVAQPGHHRENDGKPGHC